MAAYIESEHNLKRKSPRGDGHNTNPCLLIEDETIRRALVAWYCGLFSKKGKSIDRKERQRRGRAMKTLNKNMGVKKWSADKDADATNALKYLKENNPEAWA